MILQKKITRSKLLIWIVTFLALTSEVSFSEEGLGGKLDTNAITEEFVSDENQPNPTKLYTIKLHHKDEITGANKSSDILLYAAFEDNKYVVVCQAAEEKYQDAHDRCEAVKGDIHLGEAIKTVDSRDTKDFRASIYRSQNKIWKFLSKIFSRFKNYPVNIDALLAEPSSRELAEFALEEQKIVNNQNEEIDEHHAKVITNDLENRGSKSQSLPPRKLKKSHYDYGIDDYTISKDDLSGEVNSGLSNFDIGMGSLGIAGFLAAGAEFAAYKNKWWWHAEDKKYKYERLHGIHSVGEMVDSSLLSHKGYIPPSPLQHKVQNESEFNFKVNLISEMARLSPSISEESINIQKNMTGIYKNINWYISRVIGSGSYGKVFQVNFNVPGENQEISFAFKQVKKAAKWSSLEKEIDMLDLFNGHPRFVKYYGKIEDSSGSNFLIMEQMDSSIEKIDIDNVEQLFFDLLAGLEAMREKNILHGDIKPENILTKNGRYYIADLGGANKANIGFSHSQVSSSALTRDPEYSSVKYSSEYEKRQENFNNNHLLNPFTSDLYSVGITMIWKKYFQSILLPVYREVKDIKPIKEMAENFHQKIFNRFNQEKIEIQNPEPMDLLILEMIMPSANDRISLKKLKIELEKI